MLNPGLSDISDCKRLLVPLGYENQPQSTTFDGLTSNCRGKGAQCKVMLCENDAESLEANNQS